MHVSTQPAAPAEHDTPPALLVPLDRAAAMLGVAERTVRELIRTGEIPCRRLGRLVMIERAALDAFISGLPVGRAAGLYGRMAEARQAFVRALNGWLAAAPAAGDAEEEVAATLSAVRQLAALRGVRVEGAPS